MSGSDSAETSALLHLLVWLSPSYPVGAFAFSHALEWAVEAGDIADRAGLVAWLEHLLSHGGPANDAALFAHAHRAAAAGDAARLAEVAELAQAFHPSAERRHEALMQGDAFVKATRAAFPCAALERLAAAWDGPVAYPVAVGAAAAGHAIALDRALPAFLHAVAANLVSAAVRLVPLGQTDGLRALAALEGAVLAAAARAREIALDDLGGAAFRSDIAAMRHETQRTRLFRT